ncbi:MAG: hypothetical protein PW735_03815 [Acidobacteriaceae bacterium]|nr:hypothetical protein [Acidobacteriaceae bacterium]
MNPTSPSQLRGLTAAQAASLPPLLLALWHDAQGNWEQSHAVAQEIATPGGSWVHAYLHRKEGDDWNAGYWYRQAGKSPSRNTLDQEWERIAATLLAEGIPTVDSCNSVSDSQKEGF